MYKTFNIIAFFFLVLITADVNASIGWKVYLFLDLEQQAELTKAVCLERDAEEGAVLTERYIKWLETNNAELVEIEKIKKTVLEAAVERARPEHKAGLSSQFSEMKFGAIPLLKKELAEMNVEEIKVYCRSAFKYPEKKDERVQKVHRFILGQLEEMVIEKIACEKAIEERKQGGINDCREHCACPPLTPAQTEQKTRADASLEASIINDDFVEFENLLDFGVDVDKPKYQNSRAPLLLALEKSESAPFAITLIKRGANLTPAGLYEGVNVLMLAAGNSTPEVMKALLAKQKFDVNQRNPNGATALSYAVASGRIDNVRLLLELGADPQVKTNEGSLIDIARLQGHTEIVKLLERRK